MRRSIRRVIERRLPDALLRALRPSSLRQRLVLGATLLAVAAVITSQVIGLLVLHSWLLGRVDRQLNEFASTSQSFSRLAVPSAADIAPGSQLPQLPSEFRVYYYDTTGRLARFALGSGAQSPPALATTLDTLTLLADEPTTIAASAGSGSWRALRYAGPGGTTLVAALPLDTVNATMSKLAWLDLAVLLAVAIALIAVGRWVVRLGLLPLTRMGTAAQRVTAGNLDLRLPDTDRATEVGRLGLLLNAMLEQLQGALIQRESSEARLRRFVADAGHELRTPLTSVRGFAELVAKHDELSDEDRREAVRQIKQNAERMSLLVDDLLLLARLDQEPAYRREPVDLLAIAADAVSAAAVSEPKHPIRLTPLTAPAQPIDDQNAQELDVPEIAGDPHRLRQVVGNLVTNALIHTPPGAPVYVRVGETHASATAGGVDRPGRASVSPPLQRGTPVVVIEVADEGPGLDHEQAQRVFERFYRVDPSRSRAQGGTGLGLAIAAAIAQGHSGRLELDTQPGHGCTFRLILPRSERDMMKTPPPQISVSGTHAG